MTLAYCKSLMASEMVIEYTAHQCKASLSLIDLVEVSP